jgi:hypothetical protein
MLEQQQGMSKVQVNSTSITSTNWALREWFESRQKGFQNQQGGC